MVVEEAADAARPEVLSDRRKVQALAEDPGIEVEVAVGAVAVALHRGREVGGMEVEHIPYKGSAPALQDLMSGQVSWMMETFSTTLQQHRAGKVRILAYAHAQRAPIAPEIPTMIEAGVKGYEAYTFNLILGPAGLPQSVVDTVDQASRKMMADPDMIKFLLDIAAVPTTDTTPERTAKFIRDEIAKWAPVIRATGTTM